MAEDIKQRLLQTYGLLAKAAARKKVYSLKARKDGRPEVSHLLRAVAESELVQARRLMHGVRGQIDTSTDFLATLFEEELPEILAEYEEILERAEPQDKALLQALEQLKASEKRIKSFYNNESRDLRESTDQDYSVCQFCGYIVTGEIPESCPICSAPPSGFHMVN